MNKAVDHYSSQNILAKISRNLRILREKFAGLDITPSVDNKTLGLEEFGEEIYYAPSERKDLRKTFTQLNIQPSDRILDYGAGKGAAMLILDEFGFAEVAGDLQIESLQGESLHTQNQSICQFLHRDVERPLVLHLETWT